MKNKNEIETSGKSKSCCICECFKKLKAKCCSKSSERKS